MGARGLERRGGEGMVVFLGGLYRERISGCGFVSFSLNLEINKEIKTLFFLIIPCRFFFWYRSYMMGLGRFIVTGCGARVVVFFPVSAWAQLSVMLFKVGLFEWI